MHRINYFLIFICVQFLFSTALFACDVTDDAGIHVHLSKPAARIISLAPDITEILFAIGAGDHVVGVIRGSDYPNAARHLSQVGSYSGIDLEKVMALHPDLIVTWSHSFSQQLSVLKNAGIAVYTTEPKYLNDIPLNMKKLGCLTGTETQANQAAATFSARLAALQKAYHSQKVLRVFYQLGMKPLMTVNKDSWINQAITLCGGQNIFANSKLIAPEVSWEAVVVANPQVIINGEKNEEWKQAWKAWPMMAAVKNQALFNIDPDLIDRAGPRLVDGVAAICEDLQLADK